MPAPATTACLKAILSSVTKRVLWRTVDVAPSGPSRRHRLSASLMVSAPTAHDTVSRARRLPDLPVNLPLVLADRATTLLRRSIPALVDQQGHFGQSMVRYGLRFYLLPHVRRQFTAEIRAQFDAIYRTRLTRGHVNTPKHFHLYPTVLSLIFQIGPEDGMRTLRLPFEANSPACIKPWVWLVVAKLDRAGIARSDYLVSISETEKMDEKVLLEAIAGMSAGMREIYSHPALPGDAPLTPAMNATIGLF